MNIEFVHNVFLVRLGVFQKMKILRNNTANNSFNYLQSKQFEVKFGEK